MPAHTYNEVTDKNMKMTNFVDTCGCDTCYICVVELPVDDNHDHSAGWHSPVLCDSCTDDGWVACGCGAVVGDFNIDLSGNRGCVSCNELF